VGLPLRNEVVGVKQVMHQQPRLGCGPQVVETRVGTEWCIPRNIELTQVRERERERV